MTQPRQAAVALIHHPVLGRRGEALTTTITSLDLHDLARSVRAYGLERLYVVHPLASQRALSERIRAHWVSGSGRRRIPDRAEALERLCVVPSLEQASADLWPAEHRSRPERWVTTATDSSAAMPYAKARARLEQGGPPVLLCFGTGWGLGPELMATADARLEPIAAGRETGYNHLSVRAACAIVLDRLFGPTPS